MRKLYKDANYHLQASGDHDRPFKTPKPDSEVCGVYDVREGELVIEHLPEGPTGLPELKLSFENGRILTVCCEDTAREYLKMWGAKKAKRKQRHTPGVVDVGFWQG